jgi:glycosyltransferase involved in cell wall biosynthesis
MIDDCAAQFDADTTLTMPRRAVPLNGRLRRIIYEQTRLASLLADCDLLHAPAYVMPLNWRKPSVLTVYDLIALQFPQWCKHSNALHYGLMLPRSLRRASAIIAPSHTVADAISERFPKVGDKVRVIVMGVDEAFRPASPDQVADLLRALAIQTPYLLYVGNLEPKKNVAAIVAAFDQIADRLPHSLVLHGAWAWRCDDVRRAIESARHPERIILVPGYLPRPQLASLYTGADLLVQWSLYEGFGLPPLEAMACGTPAVVSDGGALPEVAGPAACVVPLGPPESLAEALLALLADQAQLADLRRRGLDHAAKFTWDAHARAAVALYEEF